MKALCMSSLTWTVLSLGTAGVFAADASNSPQTAAATVQPYENHCAFRGKNWQEFKLESIEGRIEDVVMEKNCMAVDKLLQFKISSADGEYMVHLGPSWYVNPRRFRFAIGDEVKITGVGFESKGVKMIVASQIEKQGSAPLKLRDEQGQPAWGGRSKIAPSHRGEPATSH